MLLKFKVPKYSLQKISEFAPVRVCGGYTKCEIIDLVVSPVGQECDMGPGEGYKTVDLCVT